MVWIVWCVVEIGIGVGVCVVWVVGVVFEYYVGFVWMCGVGEYEWIVE